MCNPSVLKGCLKLPPLKTEGLQIGLLAGGPSPGRAVGSPAPVPPPSPKTSPHPAPPAVIPAARRPHCPRRPCSRPGRPRHRSRPCPCARLSHTCPPSLPPRSSQRSRSALPSPSSLLLLPVAFSFQFLLSTPPTKIFQFHGALELPPFAAPLFNEPGKFEAQASATTYIEGGGQDTYL